MLFDNGLGVCRTLVLPVEVVRVLPDVDDEKRIETSIEPLAELELVRLQVPFEDCRLARRPSTKDDRLVRLSRQYRVNPRRDFILTCLHF